MWRRPTLGILSAGPVVDFKDWLAHGGATHMPYLYTSESWIGVRAASCVPKDLLHLPDVLWENHAFTF